MKYSSAPILVEEYFLVTSQISKSDIPRYFLVLVSEDTGMNGNARKPDLFYELPHFANKLEHIFAP